MRYTSLTVPSAKYTANFPYCKLVIKKVKHVMTFMDFDNLG